MHELRVEAPFEPSGDQPRAIDELAQGILRGDKYQTLMGATGTGKTFTISKVIEEIQKPTIVISHNKTLAAQLYGEFKAFFPDNAVEYFLRGFPDDRRKGPGNGWGTSGGTSGGCWLG